MQEGNKDLHLSECNQKALKNSKFFINFEKKEPSGEASLKE